MNTVQLLANHHKKCTIYLGSGKGNLSVSIVDKSLKVSYLRRRVRHIDPDVTCGKDSWCFPQPPSPHHKLLSMWLT